jgi:hypothetical protein
VEVILNSKISDTKKNLEKFFPKVVTKDTDRPPGGHLQALYEAVMVLLGGDDKDFLSETSKPLDYEVETLKKQVAIISQQHAKEIHASVIVRSKRVTTGGAAVEVLDVVGVRKNMICLAQVSTTGAVPVYVEAARCLQDQIEVTFTADPANDTTVDFVVFR